MDTDLAVYDVHTFLTNCFIQDKVVLGDRLILTPVKGVGSFDLAVVMNDFGTDQLHQNSMPDHVLQAQAAHGTTDGSSVVVSVLEIEADSIKIAVESTRELTIAVRETIALRQEVRGRIAGFYVVRTDVSPTELYVEPRKTPLKRIFHLGPTSEAEFIGALVEESMAGNGLLRQYVSLYADAVSSGDVLLTDLMLETQLMKLWTLLETMAINFSGQKVPKVVKLYNDFQIAIREDYSGIKGKSHLDVAYALRNVVVHAGGCDVATSSKDRDICTNFGALLPSIVPDLVSDLSYMIYQYAARLQSARLPVRNSTDPVSLGDLHKITFNGPGIDPNYEVVPGTISLTKLSK